ncbi:MAG: ABC transporter ATP-binding protein [Notoacmeibacter sp.]|nr:ABC transporter ATP-binding protein [Notoacmeibacter sp.]MCC0032642.1 ABC transporter ATP-binding protein [Brucellaceae bacterium]
MNVLETGDLTINRSGVPVVRDVSIIARSGEISVLLGANGAGKTTLLEGISGVTPVASGKISLMGNDVTKLAAGKRALCGIAHVEQGRSIFGTMTTQENLLVGMHSDAGLGEAYELFPELQARRDVQSRMLSGGEQQMVVIARALLGRPRVILIDEMSAGLAPVVVSRLMKGVRLLADQGLAVVLVEQFANLALQIGDRAYVMRRGSIVHDGDCASLINNPDKLHHLYLGDLGDASAA